MEPINEIPKSFGEDAAKRWDMIGKPFKRNECQSAGQALGLAIN